MRAGVAPGRMLPTRQVGSLPRQLINGNFAYRERYFDHHWTYSIHQRLHLDPLRSRCLPLRDDRIHGARSDSNVPYNLLCSILVCDSTCEVLFPSLPARSLSRIRVVTTSPTGTAAFAGLSSCSPYYDAALRHDIGHTFQGRAPRYLQCGHIGKAGTLRRSFLRPVTQRSSTTTRYVGSVSTATPQKGYSYLRLPIPLL